MGTLSELLRWKKSIKLAKDTTVWVRIIGDWDLQEAYKLARIASAKKREALRDISTPDFQDEIKAFEDATQEECAALVKAARSNQWVAEAFSTVVRPEEVKLSEVSVDPDAPTLEEQEKFDAENNKIDIEYRKALEDYSKQKELELEAELKDLSLEDLRILAQVEASIIIPLTVFMNELQDQKLWRGTYDDEECRKRSFSSMEDFRSTVTRAIKDKLIEGYTELESRVDDLKN